MIFRCPCMAKAPSPRCAKYPWGHQDAPPMLQNVDLAIQLHGNYKHFKRAFKKNIDIQRTPTRHPLDNLRTPAGQWQSIHSHPLDNRKTSSEQLEHVHWSPTRLLLNMSKSLKDTKTIPIAQLGDMSWTVRRQPLHNSKKRHQLKNSKTFRRQ